MKKIVSLLTIVSILILSIGTAFAWNYETAATGLNVVAEEDSSGLITVTVSANDTTAIQGVTVYLVLNGVKAVSAADKTTEASVYNDALVVNSDLAAAGWAATAGKYDSTTFKAVVGSSSAKVLTDQEIFKAYFLKIGDSITTSAFDFGTTTAKTSKISYTGGVQKQTKTAADQSYFGIKVIPYTAPVVDKPEEGWEAGSVADLTEENKTAWDGAFKFQGKDGTEKNEPAAGKKLVIFAKNATAKTLEAGKYGVKIGENYYPGRAAVDNGKAWAIIILDENGSKVALDSYNYTAYVETTEGEKTVFAGTVNAQ